MSLRNEIEEAAVLAEDLHLKVKAIMDDYSMAERQSEMIAVDRALGHIFIARNCLDEAFWSLDGDAA